jgi:hypothetical protein
MFPLTTLRTRPLAGKQSFSFLSLTFRRREKLKLEPTTIRIALFRIGWVGPALPELLIFVGSSNREAVCG